MPRELVAIGPRRPALREFRLPPLGEGMVRLVSEFGSPKHGTELPGYRADDLTIRTRYDDEWRCTFPRPAETPIFPRPLGNTIVGRIAESADAYRMIDERPETSVKLGVRFALAPDA